MLLKLLLYFDRDIILTRPLPWATWNIEIGKWNTQ
jgi:hypothetical protein